MVEIKILLPSHHQPTEAEENGEKGTNWKYSITGLPPGKLNRKDYYGRYRSLTKQENLGKAVTRRGSHYGVVANRGRFRGVSSGGFLLSERIPCKESRREYRGHHSRDYCWLTLVVTRHAGEHADFLIRPKSKECTE